MASPQKNTEVSWGCANEYGDDLGYNKVQDQLAGDVQSIYHTDSAFAAVKNDGSVVAWGRNTEKAKETARSEEERRKNDHSNGDQKL